MLKMYFNNEFPTFPLIKIPLFPDSYSIVLQQQIRCQSFTNISCLKFIDLHQLLCS